MTNAHTKPDSQTDATTVTPPHLELLPTLRPHPNPTSSIEDRVSSIQPPASRIEHPASDIEQVSTQQSIDPLIHQSSPPPIDPPTLRPIPQQRASAPKSRNGKIARLPFLERDMVNRMLRNNIPYSNIAEAL